MFCPKCGTEMPENGVCPVCAPKAEVKALPTAPVSKKVFLAKYATKKAKDSHMLAKIFAIVAAVLFLVGGWLTVNTAFNELPILEFTAKMAGEDVDSLKIDFDEDELTDELDDFLDEYEDDLSGKEKRAIKSFVKKVSAFVDNPSINNTNKLYKGLVKLAKLEIDDMDSREFDEMLEDSEADKAFKFIGLLITVSWISAVVLALLSLLAGFKLATGWAIFAIIYNIIPGLAFAGLIHFILLTAALVLVKVFGGKVKKEYKLFNAKI